MGTNAEYNKARKKNLIKAVHCSALWRSFYRNDRAAYEAMLSDSYGVRSSKDLNITQLGDLLNYLNGRKKQPDHMPRRKQTPKRTKNSNVRHIKSKPQQAKIRVLTGLIEWKVQDGFTRWCKKRFKFEQPKTDEQCWLVIEGLKGMFENQMEAAHGPDWATKKYDNVGIMQYIRYHKGDSQHGNGNDTN